MNVLSFGEILWDIFPDAKCIGGAPLNFAGHMSNHGHQVYLLSAVGNDKLGDEAVSFARRKGIDTSFMDVVEKKPTGSCVVTLDKNKVPSFDLKNDTAYDAIGYKQELPPCEFLYFGTLALRSTNNMETIKKILKNYSFENIVVDMNIRPPYFDEQIVRFVFENATILKVSDDDISFMKEILDMPDDATYWDFSLKITKQYFTIKTVIVTCGENGCFVWDAQNAVAYTRKAEPCTVVSTVGAGDSFLAGFLHAMSCGQSVESCMEYASKLSAYVCEHTEAIPEHTMNTIQ